MKPKKYSEEELAELEVLTRLIAARGMLIVLDGMQDMDDGYKSGDEALKKCGMKQVIEGSGIVGLAPYTAEKALASFKSLCIGEPSAEDSDAI